MPDNYTFDLNSALAAGYTPEQVAQYLDQQKKQGDNYQLAETPQATPQQSQIPAQPQNQWADWLPAAGSVIGGIGGALIPGLGETGIGEVGGAAAGSAAGEGLKELIQGKPISGKDIATQGVIGGVGGAVGRGVGAVAGKVLSKVSGAAPVLEDVATGLKQGTRQIRVKPSVYGASQEKAINATLDKYGIQGTAQQQYSQLEPTLQNIEGKIYQHIQANPDIAASRQDITDTFMKNLDSSLRSKDITAAQAKDEIQGYLDDLLKASGVVEPSATDQIPLAQLRDLKKLVNEDYGPVYAKSQAGNALTPRQKVISAAWDSLDSAVKNASPEVKGLLTDESNLYKSARSLSAARSNPPTLRVAGTSVPANVTQTGREIAAGAATLASKGVANTPGGLSPLVSQSVGQGIVRPFTGGGQDVNQYTQNGQNNPQDNGLYGESQNNPTGNFNQNILPSSPQQANNNSTIQGANSQALPKTPDQTNPLQGYTINGQPINPATANLIYKVATYQIDPTKMTSLRNDEREKIVSLALQFDPTYDSSAYPAKAAVRKDFTSGKSAQNIRSLNTAISHLNALAEAGGALGNTSFTPYNQIKNTISETTGQPQVTRFKASLNAVAGEMSTVFKGSSGTDQEIQSWRDQMGAAQSPAQIQAGINQMIELMAGRLQALESQYQTGLGKPADFSFLNPSSQTILQNMGIDPTRLANPDALPATP